MCLQILDKKLRGTSISILTGYKLFRTSGGIYDDGYPGPYRFRYFNHRDKAKVPLNRWLKSQGKVLHTNFYGKKYKGGFHIYTEKITPLMIVHCLPGYVVVKVFYRGVLARGREEALFGAKVSVVVAGEMYVPHKEKK